MESDKFWNNITQEQRIVLWTAITWDFTPQSERVENAIKSGEYEFGQSLLKQISSSEDTYQVLRIKEKIEPILKRKPDASISEVLVALKGRKVFIPNAGAIPGASDEYPDWM